MLIGQNIKRLRKNANMTQEELAEMLSISSQAISRWETDSAMPDISLIPLLCNIFNVSADEILGIDIEKKNDEINEIRKKANEFHSRGYNKEARVILDDGIRKFPNSYLIIRDLMYVASDQSNDNDYNVEQRKLFREETIQLGEKILASCTDDDIRSCAIQVLSFTYKDKGETDKAKSLARKMPHMAVCQQALMSRITEGDEKLRARQRELYNYIQFLEVGICNMNTKLDNGEWRYSEEEVSLLRNKAITLLDVIFEDGNFRFYNSHLTDMHIKQAQHYAKLKSEEKAIHHIEKASECALKFLDWCQGGEYTCLLFKGMRRGKYSTNDSRNKALYVLEAIKNSEFEFLFNTKEYIEIKDKLEPLAKHL